MSKPSENTLWLPEGSIRAIITILLVATGCYMVILGKDVPEWFVGTIGLCVGSYFNKGQLDGIRETFKGLNSNNPAAKAIMLFVLCFLIAGCATVIDPVTNKKKLEYLGPPLNFEVGAFGAHAGVTILAQPKATPAPVTPL